MEFRISGQAVRVTREDVERKLRRLPPEPLRVHAVEVNRTLYPVKQALEVVIGMDRADFTSHTARRIFKALGLHVTRLE